MTRFYRSKEDKIFFGICGALAKHTNVDPLLWRLLFVLFSLCTPIILLYIVTAIITDSE